MDKVTTKQLLTKGFKVNGNKWEYHGSKPCVIDFYADWCQPCKRIESTLNELSSDYGDVEFVKVNVEDEYELAEIFSIRSLPTVIFCSKESTSTITGVLPKSKIESHIKHISTTNVLV